MEEVQEREYMTLRLPENKLRQLEAISPDHARNATARVIWAIDEFFRLRKEANASDAAKERN